MDDNDCSINNNDNGWEDEDDLEELLGLNDNDHDNDGDDPIDHTNNNNNNNNKVQNFDNDEGWDWDDNDDDDNDGDDVSDHQQYDNTISTMEGKLMKYINMISDPSQSKLILNNINDILKLSTSIIEESSTSSTSSSTTSSSTSTAALQLCRYYHQRPNLTSYTIDIEVPRMDYQIIISDQIILDNQHEIKEYFQLNPIDNLVDDMLLRASNQSLLADLFPVLSMNNKNDNNNNMETSLVQQEFFASAIATKCRFVLDMRKDHTRTTQVECTMTICIPCQQEQQQEEEQQHAQNKKVIMNNNKLNIANARFMIHFSPDPTSPFVNYQLISIQPLIDLNNHDHLESIHYAAMTIQEMNNNNNNMMEGNEDLVHDNNNMTMIETMTDSLRDNFLQSIITTQSGFKSALQEIDDVVNVSKKLSYIKDVLPILPSADDMMRAANEAEEEYQKSNDVSNTTIIDDGHNENMGHIHNTNAQSQKQLPKAGRPIIGGLLMSGISHLADAVKAPTSSVESNAIPKLYRRDDTADSTDVIQRGMNKNNTHDMSRNSDVTHQKHQNNNEYKLSQDIVEEEVSGDDEDRWSDLDDIENIDVENDTASNGDKDNNNIIIMESQEQDGTWNPSQMDHSIDLEHDHENDASSNINDDLIIKMNQLLQIKVDMNTLASDDFVYDDTTGIIPTRKRFISRSDRLPSIMNN